MGGKLKFINDKRWVGVLVSVLLTAIFVACSRGPAFIVNTTFKGIKMLKNYNKEGQKLPLFGVGPYMVWGMGLTTLLGIILIGYVLRVGYLDAPWIMLFRMTGVLLLAIGIAVWFIGAVRSDMDNNIENNKLKTDGIYAWVRNPMYSGWWIAITGITLMWHNVWMLILPVINWIIMTITLINSEEKWLSDLYGDEYAAYKIRVNRCIPWKPSKDKK